MHMAWVRTTCGRLKSDFRYSKDIVYNNFPWPQLPDPAFRRSAPNGRDRQRHPNRAPAVRPTRDGAGDSRYRAAIEAAAQAVSTPAPGSPTRLADPYDPLTMPPALVKAHAALDKAVDAAYLAAAGRKPPKLSTDAERVAFLFERYQALTSLLPADKAEKGRASAAIRLGPQPTGAVCRHARAGRGTGEGFP